MIEPAPHICINESEIEESFVRASGPGGQNVNKVETAVQLRFDAKGSDSIPAPVFTRLRRIAGKRMTKDGVLVITARTHRTQARNRADALARLNDLVARAAEPPKKRKRTGVTPSQKRKRLDAKKQHAHKKSLRGKPDI